MVQVLVNDGNMGVCIGGDSGSAFKMDMVIIRVVVVVVNVMLEVEGNCGACGDTEVVMVIVKVVAVVVQGRLRLKLVW